MSGCCFVAEEPLRLTGDGTTGDCWCISLVTANSSCILLDMNSGALEAEVIEDPDPCNALECRPTGLFVPAEHQGLATLDPLGDPYVQAASLVNVTLDQTVPSRTVFETSVLTATIENPSTCRSAVWFVTVGGTSSIVTLDNTPGVAPIEIEETLQLAIGAAPFAAVDTKQFGIADLPLGPTVTAGFGQQGVPVPLVLLPGASQTVRIKKRFEALSGTPTVENSGNLEISGVLLTI
jgi:hypothetical protein